MKPTTEQEIIIKDFADTRVMKVNAVAGSGKTSTLELLAAAYRKPSLYMAFNKSIATEASERFPNHVECRTTHSLAYAEFGSKIRHKMSRPRGGYVNVAGTPSEIMQYYRIKDFEEMPALAIATLVYHTIKRFEQSADKFVAMHHCPTAKLKELCKMYDVLDLKAVRKEVQKITKNFWEDRIDVDSDVMASHDTYLKMWHLSSPRLDYDIIYLDEAQDTNPVVLDIVRKQEHAKVCYVGDTYQSIYQFRGAVDAMEQVNAPTRILSMSFRYGQEIADEATDMIDGAIEIKGNPKIKSVVGEVDMSKPYTKIYRTNGLLLSEAVELVKEGKKVKCEVDATNLIKLLESAQALFKGDMRKVKHPDVVPYQSWSMFMEAGEFNPDIKRAAQITEKGLSGMFIKYLAEVKKTSREDYDVLLTTAHKSKGRQWDQVVIADDYPDTDESGRRSDPERNLLYVALTRAVEVLEIASSITCGKVSESTEVLPTVQ